LRLSQENNEKLVEAWSWFLLRTILGKTEPLEMNRAEECILKGVEISDELKLRSYSSQGYLFLGELFADTGQKEKAKDNLKKAEGMFREMGMDYWLGKAQDVLAAL